MKATLFAILLCCLLSQVQGQNLVKNPGLELYKKGVIGFRKVSGTPDIASKNDHIIQYPPYYNSYQDDLPTRSVATIQFGENCLCQWFGATSSELTQVELRKRLKKNKAYEVSLYTIRASVIEPAIKEITVYFTSKRLPGTRNVYGIDTHELTGKDIPYLSLASPSVPVLSSRDEWVKVSAVYKAKGGEKYLTVGNFLGANLSALEAMNPQDSILQKNEKLKGTYYCYDNFSVVPLSEAVKMQQAEVTAEKVKATPVKAPFAIGKTITLSDVNFASGSHQILPVAYPLLDSLAAFVKSESGIKMHIRGHTDDVGSEEDNLQLSINRAEAVKAYLQQQGVKPDILTATGFGETAPKVANSSPENRALNRRVEIELKAA